MIDSVEQLTKLYTPLPEAIARLKLRSDAPQGLPLPDGISPARYAVFPRQVATPSQEVFRFLSLAETYNLIPLFFEFHADKFVTRNRCKFALARMRFEDAPSTNGASKFLTIVDIQAAQGKSFTSIQTLWNESFIEFHHSLLCANFPNLSSSSFFDGSAWFRAHGDTPRDYYQHFLSLFVSGCVLFESYLSNCDEIDFTREIVVPAFNSVCAAFGSPPLIVRLDPPDTEGHSFWLSYPTSIHQPVAGCLSSGGKLSKVFI